jgi:alpha-2-macroglobulin
MKKSLPHPTKRSVVGLLLAIPVLLFSCSGSDVDEAEIVKIDPKFSRYVSAFTGGTIPSDGTIKVQFVEPVGKDRKADDMSAVFQVYPESEGVVTWLDDQTLQFKPGELLHSGIRYKGSINLAELMTVESGFELFEFNFRTIKKDLNLDIEEFATYHAADYTKQKMTGRLRFTDLVDSTQVKNVLTAMQDGEALPVTVERESKYVYRFTVDNIERKASRSELHLEWSGEPLGIQRKDEKTIKIPSKDEFVVMDVEVNQAPEQFVRIHFSDPLNTEQFYEGLVYLQDHDATLIAEEQVIMVYPTDRIVGFGKLFVDMGIENARGQKLEAPEKFTLQFEDTRPEIQLVGEGNIVPKTGESHFPFKAVNLTAVDVTITKIFEDNVLQFLQENTYNGTYQLRRVGREVHKERLDLNPDGDLDLHDWNSFSLNLADYVALDPGAIYRVELTAKKEYSLYECTSKPQFDEALTTFAFTDASEEWNESDWYGYSYDDYYYDYEYDYYYEDYDYEAEQRERNNPCNDKYYNDFSIARNIIVSDIAMIAKAGGDKTMHMVLTDLNTTDPMMDANIKFYDFQQQFIGQATTNEKGMAELKMDRKPFVAVAEKDGQRGYLKLNDGESLSLSKFDVSGETVQNGVKGFIYTERGVWRPGDSLFISFMMEDKEDVLPGAHPVKFELSNPKGQVIYEKTKTVSRNGIYDFRTKTRQDALTGNYSAKVTVGNRTFYKTLKVETVKPNRLKINLAFAGQQLNAGSGRTVNLDVAWLHGAVANGLKAKVDVHLEATTTTFKKFDGFVFDDPLKEFTAEDKTIFEGNLDANGKLSFDHGIELTTAAPGMLKAYFSTKVFESGGDFSVDRTSVVYSPYSQYAGIRVPKGDLYGGTLVTGRDHAMDIVTLNENGSFVQSKVQVKVDKLEWRWWWDSYDSDLASYISREGIYPVQEKNLTTTNGKASFKFRVDQPEWGRYLILVKDEVSGHTTGQIVFVDWPYEDRSNRANSENATMLSFSADKEVYTKGETVKLSIPTPEAGKALISLESGTRIIDKFWVETIKGETKCEFVTTEEMDPNVFVHVTLIQPYENLKNDLPIRMYGVIPIAVEDPASHLQPVIQTTEVWKPESKTVVKVGEKNGKPMTYTLAIVDDGLLDLTNFKTPDPWNHFYAREALGVKTWDMYDYVLGSYAEEMDKLLAIGGDGDGLNKKGAKANRFEPMVRFLGPFETDGNVNSHTIQVPNYVGSVRVMVVAGENTAYGHAEKTVPVRNPLMVLGTLPRVVGPGETVTLPVNVFAMEDKIKNVSITVSTNEFFTIEGSKTQSLTFKKVGDQISNFKLKVAEKTGVGTVSILATSGKEKAKFDFEIDVRTPNAEQVKIEEKILNAGESYSGDVDYFGVEGTNLAYLEVSNFPSIDLGKRLDYLISYPHGCIEQTTSSVFPQLYLADVMEMDVTRKSKIQTNITAAIERIKSFQTANGGFAYWPGESYDDEWGSNYAGHFLLEAEKKGFSVPSGMKSNWLEFQKKQARNWSKANQSIAGYYYDDLMQAYRLFTLALAGKPEIGLMNRLRERADLSVPARWRLAAAYKIAGQKEVAIELITGQGKTVPAYTELSYTFGSDLRDEAMIVETLVLLDMKTDAALMAKEIADRLNNDEWMSTQTTAYSLLAVSKYLGSAKGESKLKFSYTVNGQSGSRNSALSMVSFELGSTSKSVEVKNTGTGIVYIRLITKGTPVSGGEVTESSNITMSVNYYDMKNNKIDVAKMVQGTDFLAEIKVTNTSVRGDLQELALSHIVPSGWEIHNSRMDEFSSDKSSYFTYQDIRDDRIYTYFDLGYGQSKTFRVQLNSSYLGKFYMPGISVEAMYDNTIFARVKGQWVSVE